MYACQSARTEKWECEGEVKTGSFGLANAFMLAGVKHYIGTSWDIMNEPSSRFARQFYKNLLSGETVGESVKQARLNLIGQGDEACWTSYLLYGDPRECYFDVDKNMLAIPEETVLRQLNKSDELPDDPLYLKLNSLDRIVLNVVAYDLGIRYEHAEKAKLVRAIFENRERKVILKELENKWDEIFLKLNGLDQGKLSTVGKKLGIKDSPKQEKYELIENILKNKDKSTIISVLNKWDINITDDLSSIIGILLGIIGIVIGILFAIYA